MKTTSLIARILLGLLFFVFGLNGFVRFLPMGAMPSGLAGQFVAALIQSHYMTAVSALQLISGALLLVNRYVPLALAVLAPIIVNIDLYHVFMAPDGLPRAIVVSTLWLLVAFNVRSAFRPLYRQRAQA